MAKKTKFSKKMNRIFSKKMDRRMFLKLTLMAGAGIAGFRASEHLDNLDHINYLDFERPDKVFFQVADFLGLDYKNPNASAYMQPPQVFRGVDGCSKNVGGCALLNDNIAYIGSAQLGIKVHELAHWVFEKYRMHVQEQFLRDNFDALKSEIPKLRDKTLEQVLEKAISYKQSYLGYPDSKMLNLEFGILKEFKPDSTLHEFVAYSVSTAMADGPTPPRPDFATGNWETDPDDGIELIYLTKEAYGKQALPDIVRAIVKTTNRKYDMGQLGADALMQNIIRPIASELGYG